VSSLTAVVEASETEKVNTGKTEVSEKWREIQKKNRNAFSYRNNERKKGGKRCVVLGWGRVLCAYACNLVSVVHLKCTVLDVSKKKRYGVLLISSFFFFLQARRSVRRLPLRRKGVEKKRRSRNTPFLLPLFSSLSLPHFLLKKSGALNSTSVYLFVAIDGNSENENGEVKREKRNQKNSIRAPIYIYIHVQKCANWYATTAFPFVKDKMSCSVSREQSEKKVRKYGGKGKENRREVSFYMQRQQAVYIV
jgi:hypothetical protein